MTPAARARAAWLAVAALAVGGALALRLAGDGAREALVWRADVAGAEPWRALGAAWVHLSDRHLAANVAGAALVAAWGWVGAGAGADLRRAALAWALAWPATQALLPLMAPDVPRYGGLSGVLHAGAGVAALALAAGGAAVPPAARAIGAAVLAGIALKVAAESPLAAPALRPPDGAGWRDIAVVPAAHLAGLLAGAAAWLALGAGSALARRAARGRGASPVSAR